MRHGPLRTLRTRWRLAPRAPRPRPLPQRSRFPKWGPTAASSCTPCDSRRGSIGRIRTEPAASRRKRSASLLPLLLLRARRRAPIGARIREGALHPRARQPRRVVRAPSHPFRGQRAHLLFEPGLPGLIRRYQVAQHAAERGRLIHPLPGLLRPLPSHFSDEVEAFLRVAQRSPPLDAFGEFAGLAFDAGALLLRL